MNGKPFLDGGKGKVLQFSTNVSEWWLSVAKVQGSVPWPQYDQA